MVRTLLEAHARLAHGADARATRRSFLCAGRWVLLGTAVALAGGCQTFPNPYPKYPATLTAKGDGHEQLKAVKKNLVDYQSKLEAMANEQIEYSSYAEVAGLAGVIAASVAAVFKAPRDAVLGLGLAGGTSFSINSIFFGRGYADVYQAGRETLNCMHGVVNSALEAGNKDLAVAQPITDRVALVKDFLKQGTATAAEKPTLMAAVYDGERALGQIGRIALAEGTIADNVDLAMRAVADAMWHQINARRPDQATMIAAVKSLANGNVVDLGPAKTQLESVKPKARLDEDIVSVEDALAAAKYIEEQVQEVNQVDNDFRKSMIDNLAKCHLDVSTLPPIATPLKLNIEGGTVTLKASETKTIPVTGGVPNYATTWVDATPTDIIVSFDGTKLSLRSESTLQAPKTYKLRVSDSAKPSSSTADLTVMTAAPDSGPTTGAKTLKLKKGETATLNVKTGGATIVTIEGATAPYTFTWGGTTPKDVEATISKEGVVIQAKGSITTSGAYPIKITDSAGASVVVTVQTTAEPASAPARLTTLKVKSGESATISLKAGATKFVAIQGGVPVYTTTWIGTQPQDIDTAPTKEGVIIRAQSSLAVKKIYQVRVADSAKPTNASIVVTIRTVK